MEADTQMAYGREPVCLMKSSKSAGPTGLGWLFVSNIPGTEGEGPDSQSYMPGECCHPSRDATGHPLFLHLFPRFKQNLGEAPVCLNPHSWFAMELRSARLLAMAFSNAAGFPSSTVNFYWSVKLLPPKTLTF